MKHFFMQSSPASCYLGPNIIPSNLFPNTLNLRSCLSVIETNFRTHTKQQVKLILYILISEFAERIREDKISQTKW